MLTVKWNSIFINIYEAFPVDILFRWLFKSLCIVCFSSLGKETLIVKKVKIRLSKYLHNRKIDSYRTKIQFLTFSGLSIKQRLYLVEKKMCHNFELPSISGTLCLIKTFKFNIHTFLGDRTDFQKLAISPWRLVHSYSGRPDALYYLPFSYEYIKADYRHPQVL